MNKKKELILDWIGKLIFVGIIICIFAYLLVVFDDLVLLERAW